MFDNNVPGCLDIAPGRNTAYHIDGAIHLQLARHSGYVLPDNQHIGNQNASGRKLKFPVHFRPSISIEENGNKAYAYIPWIPGNIVTEEDIYKDLERREIVFGIKEDAIADVLRLRGCRAA